MEVKLDLNILTRNKITPNQAVFLYLLYRKEWDKLKNMYSFLEAVDIKNSLIGTKYILDKSKDKKILETTISNNHVCKLFGIRSDKINFIEFYNIYPIKVGNRVLRAANVDTVLGRKHEKKYLNKIFTTDQHEAAKKATQAFINKQRISNSMNYLPNIETVINNAMWEQWTVFEQAYGQENASWNTETI